MILTPKNWKSFQHYKDRAPAWIKLHRGLLDDFEFCCLPVASKALAPFLWLLASEYEDGQITASLDELAFRLRMTRGELADALSPLVQSGFFDASEPLAERKQIAIPEKEREIEEEDIDKREREPRAKRATRLPNDWVLPENDRTFALGKGLPMQRVQIEALKFLNYWTAKGGQGATKTDWSKTWQNWILTATQGVPTNGRRTVHDAARDLHEQTVAAVLAFDEPAPRSLCDGTSPDVIRLLPPGRRQ